MGGGGGAGGLKGIRGVGGGGPDLHKGTTVLQLKPQLKQSTRGTSVMYCMINILEKSLWLTIYYK